jgi:agmatine deiminase
MKKRVKAEWERHRVVLMAFPNEDTDWAKYGDLKRAVVPFLRISQAIAYFQSVYILCRDRKGIETLFCNRHNITFIECDYNDTWTRDYGALSVDRGSNIELLDFEFDGWGGKFEASLDNRINRLLHKKGYFGVTPMKSINYVLEGGSIDTDGAGTALTTTKCLCNPNRNGGLTKREVEETLKEHLGIERVLWVENGYIAGDDTDSHIDTLARFVSNDTILYQSCDDPKDEHFIELKEMERQLKSFRGLSGEPYNLLPLPFPSPKFNKAGDRLPATYANFLIINGAVLYPTYKDPKDREVGDILRGVFPNREIIAIDSSYLISQGGSLHCSTMQIDY